VPLTVVPAADGFGDVMPTRECGYKRAKAQREFQMRNKSFISSMVGVVAAAAVAGSVNAATVIDNFATSFGPGYSTIQSGAGILGERTTTNGWDYGAGSLTFTNPGIKVVRRGVAALEPLVHEFRRELRNARPHKRSPHHDWIRQRDWNHLPESHAKR